MGTVKRAKGNPPRSEASPPHSETSPMLGGASTLVGVRIAPEVLSIIDRLASDLQRTRSQVIRFAIEEYLSRRGKAVGCSERPLKPAEGKLAVVEGKASTGEGLPFAGVTPLTEARQ
jgi:predicted transcriptional regulator